eukprot:CAMPEP_0114266468 /NCGR_PEP_ID=MMETSP0058-20121206/24633_1 /TAXON_ID=36894 /ORGANISM="Pyramimonas parkeae, CCMP726" /LENGTH=51 /DNA_ID=CAMNT_0001383965 /DNA_START=196 /DNA_END=351 /DNA_ORIENTATION=+
MNVFPASPSTVPSPAGDQSQLCYSNPSGGGMGLGFAMRIASMSAAKAPRGT